MSGFHWAMSSQSYFDVVSVDYQTCLCNIPQLLMWDFLLQNGWSKPTNSWQEAISRKQSWLAFLQTTSGFEIYPLAPIPETKQPRNDHWKSWSPWKTCLWFFFHNFLDTPTWSKVSEYLPSAIISSPTLLFFSASKSAFNVASCFSVSAISWKNWWKEDYQVMPSLPTAQGVGAWFSYLRVSWLDDSELGNHHGCLGSSRSIFRWGFDPGGHWWCFETIVKTWMSTCNI